MRTKSRIVMVGIGLAFMFSVHTETTTYRLDQVLPLGAGAPPQFGLSVAVDGNRVAVASADTPDIHILLQGFT